MPDINRFYVYEHRRNDTNQIFYVGKGSGNRLNSTRATHRNIRWLRTTKKAGGFYATKIIDKVDEELAFFVEMERIDQLKRIGFDLCNITNGGDGLAGFKHSQDSIKKMSVKWKPGRVMSQKQRDSISNSMKSRIYSEETLRKMSEAQLGKKHSLESRQKMCKAQAGKNKGIIRSQEFKNKISASMSGIKHHMWGKSHSEETRLKISNSTLGRVGPMLGKKVTIETKNKMSQAHLGEKSHLFGVKQPIVECPHCGKFGGDRTMTRWHFDRCRLFKKTEI